MDGRSRKKPGWRWGFVSICSVGGGQILREAGSWALNSVNFLDTMNFLNK